MIELNSRHFFCFFSMRNIIKHYPLTLSCSLIIWILCLIPIPETPLDNVAFIDKWTHLVMYGTLTLLLGCETMFAKPHTSIGLFTLRVLPLTVVMGGLIEIVQATCTAGVRNGDWMDFFANSIGALLGLVIALVLKYSLKK